MYLPPSDSLPILSKFEGACFLLVHIKIEYLFDAKVLSYGVARLNNMIPKELANSAFFKHFAREPKLRKSLCLVFKIFAYMFTGEIVLAAHFSVFIVQKKKHMQWRAKCNKPEILRGGLTNLESPPRSPTVSGDEKKFYRCDCIFYKINSYIRASILAFVFNPTINYKMSS